ncbi:MAG: DMT family transporter [Alphaproteobacteria bacterium]|nr:DMT family transporter [Alphaproteobacteria bacterium]
MNSAAADPSRGPGLLLGIACGLVVPFVWAGWIVASRYSVTSALTPWDIAALRVGVGAILVSPLALLRGYGGLGLGKALVLTAGAGAPFAICSFGGMTFAPVADAGVLSNSAMPVFAGLIAFLWHGQRPALHQFAGFSLILVGAAAIGGEGLFAGAPGQWKGHVLFLAAGALFALYMTALRSWRVAIPQALVAVSITSAVVYVPLWALFLPSSILRAPGLLPWDQIALHAVYQGVIASFLVVTLVTRATLSLGATTVAVFLSAVPALGAIFAIHLLGEIPSWLAATGIAVATAGSLLAVLPRRR